MRNHQITTLINVTQIMLFPGMLIPGNFVSKAKVRINYKLLFCFVFIFHIYFIIKILIVCHEKVKIHMRH
jgi:hypothetical protein